ncbi:DUF1134 domain-containing protein [Sandaracinobacteroides hominis]|uniref:DUF1134 domain-containing protein n=1 Tax=Sandaracinobacteroides hominis TaxID=2780086 RepID=UPI0018F614BB|nr:DUF1134 domain-containing protein [Sandaracinobacteroides hominis]
MKFAILSTALLLFSAGSASAQDSPAELPAVAPAAAPAAAPAVVPAAPAAPKSDGSLKGDAQAAAYEIGEITTAADGAFGEATEGIAMVIQKVFADLGKPNAYIVGREGGGALVVGLRYGKGKLFSKVEGERPVHWTGPSIGPDIGGDASRSFVLVYNLHDTEELYQRFPAVEGKAYLIGGVSANYHQRGHIILVPIRLGAGWRLGANVGYLKYTREGSVIPF